MSARLPEPRERLSALQQRFRAPSRRPAFFLVLSLLTTCCLAGALTARAGTPALRALGTALCLLPLLMALAAVLVSARRNKSGLSGLRAASAETAGRVERALETEERLRKSEADTGESWELARLHLGRVVEAIDQDAVLSAGRRRGSRLGYLATGVTLVALAGAVIVSPFKIVEGVDVMLAREGLAPIQLPYLESLQPRAKFPAHLSGASEPVPVMGERVSVPVGTTIEFEIVPRFFDRDYVLTDGLRREPFVEDGAGGLIARLEIREPTELKVAVRLGDVLILDEAEFSASPVPDQAPMVVLEDAPRTLTLEDFERMDLEFSVRDDHGLSAVDVVMRSGRRETRMDVVKLDGQARSYTGGHAITAGHPFLQGAFLPVVVTVEARDNDTVTGPKWGRSAAMTLTPAPLGRKVANRHRALRAFRDELTSFLAADVRAARLASGAARQAREEQYAGLEARFESLSEELEAADRVPEGTMMFLRAQLQALAPGAEDGVRPESVVLAADSLLDELADHDAKTVAGELGALAEEIATRAGDRELASEAAQPAPLEPMLKAALSAADELAEIGRLGLDLGSVARGDLARVGRAVAAGHWERAEAAALHLAARLRRGTPSFGSKGSPGVESGRAMGGGQGTPSRGGSSAPSEYERMVEQADEIAQRHAEQLTELERLLEQARRAAARDLAEPDQLNEAGERLRQALEGLPSVGFNPGTARSEAAQARNQGEAMADSLEAHAPMEAAERGRAALDALERAKQQLSERGGWVSESALDEAKDALEDAMRLAERKGEEMSQAARQGARAELSERAQAERELAERVNELLRAARQGEARLPQQSEQALRRAAELMRQAAREMDAGRGSEAAETADRAQAELERAQPQSSSSPSDAQAERGDSASGREMAQNARVPDDAEDRARDFRERVERGLGRYGGRLSPAVRRYAEELK